MPHHVGEQVEFTGREQHFDIAALDPPAQQIQFDVTGPELGRAALGRASQLGPDPRDQLLEGEWLRHVVVRARVESGHPVGDLPLRGEQDHRRGPILPAQRSEHLEAVLAGQHQVEQDQVEASGSGEGFPVDPVRDPGHRMTLRFKATGDEVGYRLFVFDQEDAHRCRS